MQKHELRKQIRVLTKLYLRRGNQIEVIASRPVLPHNHMWMAKYGWDYMPWSLVGVASYGEFLVSDNASRIGQGCYMTFSKPTEE